MYSKINVPKLREEMKRLVPIIVDSKKKSRDPELNEANFAPCASKNFRYGGSQRRFYFKGDPDRTEKYYTYWEAMKKWRVSTSRFTKLCALLAHLRGKKHFSDSSSVGNWNDERFLKWLSPEIEEFKMKEVA